MPDENRQADAAIACYRSGVAARLTGVPVETLRVWERRYGVVGPRLSGSGQRLYSADEVYRLGIIKQLVDAGHAIGSIAALPVETLSEMRHFGQHAMSHQRARVAGTDVRIVLVGAWISSQQISAALSHSALKVVAKCTDPGEAALELAATRADIAVMELPILDDSTPDLIHQIRQACDASNGIIFYRFSPAPVLQKLRAAGYEVVRKPVDAVEVEWFCNALLRSPASQCQPRTLLPLTIAPPPPRFEENSLAALSNGGSSIYCECPRHLVELLQSLGSFEKYSAQCADRDSKDAATHRDLQWATGHARSILEEALVRLAQADGIALPASAGELFKAPS